MPIALGWGARGEARQPLGLAVVAGLLFSRLVDPNQQPLAAPVDSRCRTGWFPPGMANKCFIRPLCYDMLSQKSKSEDRIQMNRIVIAALLGCSAIWADTELKVATEERDDGYTYYTYTLSGAKPDKAVLFHLNVGDSFASALKGSTMERVDPAPKCKKPCWKGTPTTGQKDLILALNAPTNDTEPALVEWTTDGQGNGKAVAPKSSFDPKFFSVVVGAGTLLTARHADYKIIESTSTLSATSIGRKNVDLLVGGSFNLGIRHGAIPGSDVDRPWSAFISLKFTPGSTDTINGFVFGPGYRLTKYLDVIAGIGLTPKNEPSIGLRRVAFNIVTQNPNDPRYTGFIPQDLLLLRGQAPFDGFPLRRNGESIYNGDPLVRHYRAGFFIGVAFPLNLRGALAGR